VPPDPDRLAEVGEMMMGHRVGDPSAGEGVVA
jgi:hypothetical protein